MAQRSQNPREFVDVWFYTARIILPHTQCMCRPYPGVGSYKLCIPSLQSFQLVEELVEPKVVISATPLSPSPVSAASVSLSHFGTPGLTPSSSELFALPRAVGPTQTEREARKKDIRASPENCSQHG